MYLSDKDFGLLVTYMQDSYGIDLGKKKTLIESRLSSDIVKMGYLDFSSFVKYAINDKTGKAVSLLTTKLTTNYTYFMREEEHYKYLHDNILPLLERKVTNRDVRIWSAGCSSGEEAYTIAMVISEYFQSRKINWDTKVLATDISSKVLSLATNAIYEENKLAKLPIELKNKYFSKREEHTYKVKDNILNEVIFRTFNLQDDFPFKKKFHVIYCRNVMIYFDKESRRKLVRKFYNHLETGGYLFIGHSESLNGISNDFTYIKPAIYRKDYDINE